MIEGLVREAPSRRKERYTAVSTVDFVPIQAVMRPERKRKRTLSVRKKRAFLGGGPVAVKGGRVRQLWRPGAPVRWCYDVDMCAARCHGS